MLGGSGGAAGVEADGDSDEATLTSVVWAGPASVWAAEALLEVAVTAEVVRLFPCCPGDTCVEKGDWRKATPFLGTSIRYPGGRKALNPKTRSGCPWKSCDTRFITPGVSMLFREQADKEILVV